MELYIFYRLVRANTHFFDHSFIVDFVPYGASRSILLKILDN